MRFIALVLFLLFLLSTSAFAGHGVDKGPARKAIVLTAFGTSYPEALSSILNIKSRVEKAFPGIPVRLAFTSNIIRDIWQERQEDPAWQKDNSGIPKTVLYVKTPLATIADLQNEGYRNITVQPLHVFAGEQFHDTMTLVRRLASIRTMKPKFSPFECLSLGRPALGMPGDRHPYIEDIDTAVRALKSDVDEARKMDAALVYMGHGNDFFSTGIYAEFQKAMKQEYGWPVVVGCVEGFPAFDDVLNALKTSGKKNVLMKPFMVVAGDHASNDMAGEEDDAWKVMLAREGYTVKTELRGLGSVNAWADIYVSHLKDAIRK